MLARFRGQKLFPKFRVSPTESKEKKALPCDSTQQRRSLENLSARSSTEVVTYRIKHILREWDENLLLKITDDCHAKLPNTDPTGSSDTMSLWDHCTDILLVPGLTFTPRESSR